jgi:hypothetical protein
MTSHLTTSSPWSVRAGRVGGAPQSQNIAPVPLPAPPRPAPRTTVGPLSSGNKSTGSSSSSELQPVQTLAALERIPLDTAPDSVELEVWEGVVLDIDLRARSMQVRLEAKNSNLETHTAKISFDYVADQDSDLVKPGAVFYLTLFNQTVRGTVRNSQELRFRRRPDWSKQQIETIESDAKSLSGKITARPASA